jgi:hypothetical protein
MFVAFSFGKWAFKVPFSVIKGRKAPNMNCSINLGYATYSAVDFR